MAENRFASLDAPAEASADEPASPSTYDDKLAFDPVPLRLRADGLTPEKQRDYVEALADCGIARVAAARIGVSEQAIARARRRADARSFDLACEAARRIGARRLHDLAWERAVEGTIKQHFYHGELKGEERVYDNRLLTYLLGKTAHLIEPPEESEAVANHWQSWMDAMERGLPPPELPDDEPAEPEPAEPDPTAPCGDEVWQDEETGIWWTNFPPPEGFAGEEEEDVRDTFYRRTLTEVESAIMEARAGAKWATQLAMETSCRDRFFGFVGGTRDDELFSPREAETYETSAPNGRGTPDHDPGSSDEESVR